MTYQPNYSLPVELVELAAAQGLDALPEVLRIVINAAMTAERQKFLGLNLTNAARSDAATPTASSPRRSRRGWGR